MSLLTVECPRCSGVGSILAFSHIRSGRCFLCGGGRTVTIAVADQWRAEHARPDTRPPGKTIELEGLGRVTIRRDGVSSSGSPEFCLSTLSDVGELQTRFGIRDGRIYLTYVCGGHESAFRNPGADPVCASLSYRGATAEARRELRRAIQGALRLAA